MKYWILKTPDNIDPREPYGAFSFSRMQLRMGYHEAKEAMHVDVPDGFEFSGILEKDAKKSDWCPLELFAIKKETR